MRYKKATAFIYILICAALAISLLPGCAVMAEKKKVQDYLLGTEWDQTGLYARFCPENERAGCWSTALAQILYYHRLSPSGRISYETSGGLSISEDLGSYAFDWALFTDKLDSMTPEASVEQVAKYTYYTSVAVEKDFGTGSYVSIYDENYDKTPYLNIDKLVSNLGSCFGCTAKGYHLGRKDLDTNKDAIEKLIKDEIDAKRPMMLYSQGETGHATVIDGYRSEDGGFLVHINQGTGGYGNKWYDFCEPIAADIDDMEHRIIITIMPPPGSAKPEADAPLEQNFLLKTQWDTEGDYSRCCPGGQAAGGWSVALAQLLAYHKLQPSGDVSYKTSSGPAINEQLDYGFDWSLFDERLDAASSPASAEQVSKYIYYAELALERDFGTPGYRTITTGASGIDVSKALENIEKYYGCITEASVYTGQNISQSKESVNALIKRETENKRPLLLYYQPYSGSGICAVIDGYTEKDGRCFAHINAGRDGYGNQWYELPGMLGAMRYVLLITVKQ